VERFANESYLDDLLAHINKERGIIRRNALLAHVRDIREWSILDFWYANEYRSQLQEGREAMSSTKECLEQLQSASIGDTFVIQRQGITGAVYADYVRTVSKVTLKRVYFGSNYAHKESGILYPRHRDSFEFVLSKRAS